MCFSENWAREKTQHRRARPDAGLHVRDGMPRTVFEGDRLCDRPLRPVISAYGSVCSAYGSVINAHGSVCSAYGSVCSAYGSVCSAYGSVCSAYGSVCSAYGSVCGVYS
jgi:hypothetical protein